MVGIGVRQIDGVDMRYFLFEEKPRESVLCLPTSTTTTSSFSGNEHCAVSMSDIKGSIDAGVMASDGLTGFSHSSKNKSRGSEAPGIYKGMKAPPGLD